MGNNFAVMVPDRDVILSSLYRNSIFWEKATAWKDDSTTLMAEITYIKDDQIDRMSSKDLEEK